MAARGYASVKDVAELAAARGVALDDGQVVLLPSFIEAAESVLDARTNRPYAVASPTTDELHVPDGRVVYLTNRPVTAITTVKVRSLAIGGTDTTLTATSDYELIDAVNGALLVPSGFMGSLLKVTYTYGLTVPAWLSLACRELALALLRPGDGGIDPGLVAGYSVGGGDFSVTFRDAQKIAASLPPQVEQYLVGHKTMVFA